MVPRGIEKRSRNVEAHELSQRKVGELNGQWPRFARAGAPAQRSVALFGDFQAILRKLTPSSNRAAAERGIVSTTILACTSWYRVVENVTLRGRRRLQSAN